MLPKVGPGLGWVELDGHAALCIRYAYATSACRTESGFRWLTTKLSRRRRLYGAGRLERRVCAQHGRELMGWKSPVEVPTWTHREQGQPRAEGKGRTARACLKEAGVQEVRGDGQKPHSQGRGMRGELAHDSKAHRYAAYGKCDACAPTVRVLTRGDLHPLQMLNYFGSQTRSDTRRGA
jgi:hypothetical protein